MKFKTAYDTTACSGFMMKKTVDALQVTYLNGHLFGDTELKDISFPAFLLKGGDSTSDAVPAFAHPILMPDPSAASGHNKSEFLVTDGRNYGKWDTHQGQFHVRNNIEYNFAMLRLKLNAVWLKEDAQALRDLSTLPMTVFAAWISEAVGRRFALDPREQFELSILAAVFYNSLFLTEAPNEREQLRQVNNISRGLRATASDVMAVIEEVPYVATVDDFCAAAGKVIKSVRLNDLNVGLLFAILGNTWFGSNAKETMAVALEHPPTWLAVLFTAFTERTYNNSTITKVAERMAGKENGRLYMRSVLNLISVSLNA